MWAGVIAIFTAATSILGVQIKHLRVPATVQNGSGYALLDCEYTLKPDELSAEAYSGLVVKWYFNNSPSPVYQWIPGQKPQDLGILKGKLDLSHRASGHQATMHRALYIPNPTTDLSGDYKCLVSTFSDEDFMTKKMVVFVPGRNLDMVQTKLDMDAVKITCSAQGVYPQPKMAFLRGANAKTEVGVDEVYISPHHGSYDIVASKVVQNRDIETPTEFACELRIPEANYAVKRSMVYYPGLAFSANDCGSTHAQSCMLALLCFFLYIYRGAA